jgi:hypothetical protein
MVLWQKRENPGTEQYPEKGVGDCGKPQNPGTIDEAALWDLPAADLTGGVLLS